MNTQQRVMLPDSFCSFSAENLLTAKRHQQRNLVVQAFHFGQWGGYLGIPNVWLACYPYVWTHDVGGAACASSMDGEMFRDFFLPANAGM